jgi:hypothetical protein
MNALSDNALKRLIDMITPTMALHPLHDNDHADREIVDAVWAELHHRGWHRLPAPTPEPGVFTLAWRNMKENQ